MRISNLAEDEVLEIISRLMLAAPPALVPISRRLDFLRLQFRQLDSFLVRGRRVIEGKPVAEPKSLIGECILQPFLDDVNRAVTNVHAEPPAIEFLCGVQRRAATTKRIQNYVTFVRGGFDNPFQQRQRFLCRVTQPLLRHWVQDWDSPDISQRRLSRFCAINARILALINAALREFLIVVDNQGSFAKFVTFCQSAFLRRRGSPMFVVNQRVLRLARFTVEENTIVQSRKLRRFSGEAVVIMPDNLIPKMFLAENGIHDYLEIVTRCRIAVEIDTPCRFQDAMNLKEPLRHIEAVSCHRFLAQNEAQPHHHIHNLWARRF